MIRRLGRALAAAVLVLGTGVVAAGADPADTQTIDKAVADALRDVHNHGADLYNQAKDYAGAYRVYEGALRTVRPLLAHRPTTQKTIVDGLEAANKETDAARRAFVLHETIEKVRADLKAAAPAPKKPAETAKPPEPKKPPETKKPDDAKKPVEPKKTVDPKKPDDTKKPKGTTEPAPKGKGGAVTGTVTLQGKPLADGEVTFVSLDQKTPKVVTAAIKDGKYQVADLPAGKYSVTIAGGKTAKVPAKFSTTDTSSLTAEVKPGANSLNFELK